MDDDIVQRIEREIATVTAGLDEAQAALMDAAAPWIIEARSEVIRGMLRTNPELAQKRDELSTVKTRLREMERDTPELVSHVLGPSFVHKAGGILAMPSQGRSNLDSIFWDRFWVGVKKAVGTVETALVSSGLPIQQAGMTDEPLVAAPPLHGDVKEAAASYVQGLKNLDSRLQALAQATHDRARADAVRVWDDL